jgi:preprotein translocase subunit SecA
LLGGDPAGRDPIEVEKAKQEVLDLGGLHVVGASRNLLRRVDNQLLGRCGRQGDPGSYVFFVSMDDDLLINMRNHKLFYAISKSIGDGELSGKVVSRLISLSQQKHEQSGFMDRENLMKYDSVNASQQQVVYATRSSILAFDDVSDFYPLIEDAVFLWAKSAIYSHPDVSSIKYLELKESLNSSFNIDPPLLSWLNALTQDERVAAIQAEVISLVNASQITPDQLKDRLLKSMDEHWSVHLEAMSDLRSNIGYRSSVGKNPVFAFNIEAKDLFHEFDSSFKLDFVYQITISQPKVSSDAPYYPSSMTPAQKVFIALKKRPVGRNDPCPCESGLRFKSCHGLDPRFV